MRVPEIQPGENLYEYLSRVQRELGTDYVYVIYDGEVLAPVSGNVNIEKARAVLDYAMALTQGLPAGLNTVIAIPDDFEGNLLIKKLGDSAYLVAFVPAAGT